MQHHAIGIAGHDDMPLQQLAFQYLSNFGIKSISDFGFSDLKVKLRSESWACILSLLWNPQILFQYAIVLKKIAYLYCLLMIKYRFCACPKSFFSAFFDHWILRWCTNNNPRSVWAATTTIVKEIPKTWQVQDYLCFPFRKK